MPFYEGMAEAERRVWDRFLISDANVYDGFLYNVRVGQPPPPPPGAEEPFIRMWTEINQSRIDALGITEDFLTVFEVKVSAGLGAIGQAIGGMVLAQLELDDARPVTPAIVTDGIRPDATTVAEAIGIQIFIV